MASPAARLARCLSPALILFLGACGAEPAAPALTIYPGESVTVSPGQEFDITLQTVGPGVYDSVPDVSTAAVRFLDSSSVPPYLPAGPTQRFRFRALTLGRAIITFHHTAAAQIRDTVEVR